MRNSCFRLPREFACSNTFCFFYFFNDSFERKFYDTISRWSKLICREIESRDNCEAQSRLGFASSAIKKNIILDTKINRNEIHLNTLVLENN